MLPRRRLWPPPDRLLVPMSWPAPRRRADSFSHRLTRTRFYHSSDKLKRFLSVCRTATIAHQAAALVLGDTFMNGAASIHDLDSGATLPDAPSSVGRAVAKS